VSIVRLSSAEAEAEQAVGQEASWRTAVALRRPPRWLTVILVVGVLVALAWYELRSSKVQSLLLSRYAATLSYQIEAGPSPRIAFPRGGPFDAERGYARLDSFRGRLESAGYRIVEQARQSPALTRSLRWGITPPHREAPVAGLVVRDAGGNTLYDARLQSALFASFEEIPPLVVRTLLFIENRGLASATAPEANVAIDWPRLGKAGGLYVARHLGLTDRSEGGSTLAVQMEKYRHSDGGRTGSPLDKVRQLTAASVRTYHNGPDSRAARNEIVVDYLNTIPLAAAPAHGAVHGLGNGLRAWFDLDLGAVTDALNAPGAGPAKAEAFRHVLALLYAVRAPTYYLMEDRAALQQKITGYADLLARAEVIDRDLHRAMRDVPLRFAARTGRPEPAFVERRAAAAIRDEVRGLLGVPSPWEMDRLDLRIDSTVDGALQQAAITLFRQLGDRAFVDAQGLRAERMLVAGDPGRVTYSLLLMERTPAGNVLRVQADNLDRPFNMNAGMKLDLGSTAKLRTLAHYLEVVAGLHAHFAGLNAAILERHVREARDPITRWAAETLRQHPARDLDAFLGLALDRTYSASPHETFFTGGGAHTFQNFDSADDAQVLSVRAALVRSTNLVFIRLMRDLVRFHEARLPYESDAVRSEPDHPARQQMLERMADREARQHLARAYARYRGLAPGGILGRLLGERSASPRALAIAFFAWHPDADASALQAWLSAHGQPVTAAEAAALERAVGIRGLTLLDHAYLLGRHPLDIWCAGEMIRDPSQTWDALLARSEAARDLASSWLFQPRQRRAQDVRLRIRVEEDAFTRMALAWRRLGFPFERLVPSYATAIGASADRPAALADLMGIIVNDGVRRPTLTVRSLRFAGDTPYHTVLEPSPAAEERVLPAAVARALRDVLAGAVERGTARRLAGAFRQADGAALVAGGKTGSGDNRFETFGRGGQLLSSRAVSRTAVFTFYVGDRYFGVMTASVTGRQADDYEFTSALPVTVLKLLAPEINRRHALTAAPRPVAISAPAPW
jgi:membrane peptidoglycan carboxypeptidase